MSKFYEALAVLQAELQTIAGTQLSVDDKAVADSSLSKNVFVQWELLAEELRDKVPAYSNLATTEDAELYTKGMLQALWNITHYASMNVIRAVYYKDNIKQSFNYLDEAWIPKIINENTYKVGKALQTFLDSVLKDEVVNEFSMAKSTVKLAQKALKKLKQPLDQRLQIYEMHQPVMLEDTYKWMGFHTERVSKTTSFNEQFNAKQQQMAQKLSETRLLINAPLTEDSQLLSVHLAQLQETYEQYQQMIPQVNVSADSWNAENVSTENIPENLTVSTFMLLSRTSTQYLSDELLSGWFHLYNSDQLELFEYPVLSDLQEVYTKFKASVQNDNEQVTKNFNQQKQQLEHKIIDTQSFASFAEQLNNYVTVEQVISNDVVVQYENKTIGPLVENIDAYSQLVEQIKAHKQLLEEQRQRLVD